MKRVKGWKKLTDEQRADHVRFWGVNEDGTYPALHEDLQGWVFTTDSGWPMLNHPLVQMLGYDDTQAGQANNIYAHKQECLAKYRAAREWYGWCAAHERPYRLQAFLDVSLEVTDREYWETLRWIWTDSENIWQNAEDWQELLGNTRRKGRGRWFMTKDERADLGALPATFEVWRGTNSPEDTGSDLSWTLDRAKAEWFARRWSHKGSLRLLHGEVARRDVVGLVHARGEQEIVVASPGAVRLLSVTELEAGSARAASALLTRMEET